jgi:hypothetical protein
MKKVVINEMKRIKTLMGLIENFEINEAGPGPIGILDDINLLAKIVKRIKNEPATGLLKQETSDFIYNFKKLYDLIKDNKPITQDLKTFIQDSKNISLMDAIKQEIKDPNEKNAFSFFEDKLKRKLKATKKKPIVTGGGINIGVVANSQEIWNVIETDPLFMHLIDTKKGAKEIMEKWINLNIKDGVEYREIVDALPKQFEKVGKGPDKQKFFNEVFSFLKKGKQGFEATKGAFWWSLVIAVVGVGLGAWTIPDVWNWIKSRMGGKTNNTTPTNDNDPAGLFK